MTRGLRTSEFWVVLAAMGLIAWLASRGHNSGAAGAGITAAGYALGRSVVKAVAVRVETLFWRSVMSQIEGLAGGLAQGIEAKFIDGNKNLAPLNPELDALITAAANLAQKAIVVYGARLLAKVLPNPVVTPTPIPAK